MFNKTIGGPKGVARIYQHDPHGHSRFCCRSRYNQRMQEKNYQRMKAHDYLRMEKIFFFTRL
jgi:hypothetical protein